MADEGDFEAPVRQAAKPVGRIRDLVAWGETMAWEIEQFRDRLDASIARNKGEFVVDVELQGVKLEGDLLSGTSRSTSPLAVPVRMNWRVTLPHWLAVLLRWLLALGQVEASLVEAKHGRAD
jgi:hypothetical protein